MESTNLYLSALTTNEGNYSSQLKSLRTAFHEENNITSIIGYTDTIPKTHRKKVSERESLLATNSKISKQAASHLLLTIALFEKFKKGTIALRDFSKHYRQSISVCWYCRLILPTGDILIQNTHRQAVPNPYIKVDRVNRVICEMNALTCQLSEIVGLTLSTKRLTSRTTI